MTQERAVRVARDLLDKYEGSYFDVESIAMWLAGGLLAVEAKTAQDCRELANRHERGDVACAIRDKYGLPHES